MAKKSSIPIRDMMSAIDRCDFEFYSRLSKQQKKDFSPWMAMRYTSSARGIDAYHYLLMVNDIVNVDFNTLKNHPELQWKLLATCGIGRNAYHPWIPPGKGKKKTTKVGKFLHDAYPTLNRKEVDLLEELNTKEELKELAKDHGLADKDIKDLFK